MNSFEENGFVVVKNAISKDMAKLLAREFQMLHDCVYWENNIDFNDHNAFADSDSPNTFSWYGMYGFESLLDLMTESISEITGKTLAPSYSYARIYYAGSSLFRHKDRDSCRYSVTMCIEPDAEVEWPIWIQSRDGEEIRCVLEAGDMIIYCGDELEHWRDEFTGTQHKQAFFHYVDVNGGFDYCINDSRPFLGLPSDTNDHLRTTKQGTDLKR